MAQWRGNSVNTCAQSATTLVRVHPALQLALQRVNREDLLPTICSAHGPCSASRHYEPVVQPLPLSSMLQTPGYKPVHCQISKTCSCLQPVFTVSRPGARLQASTLNTEPATTTARLSPRRQQRPVQRLKNLLHAFSSSGSRLPFSLFNQLLQECASSERWPDVWESYLESESLGVKLDQQTYQCLWQAALQADWVTQSVQLFRRSAAVSGLPDQRAYTTIISRLLRKRHKLGLPTRTLAYQLWIELKDCHAKHLDAASLRAGISACCSVGRLDEAVDIMHKAAKHSILLEQGAYNRLIAAYAERGDMEKAKQVYWDMGKYYPPDMTTYNTLISGYCHLGSVDAAQQVVQHMRSAGFQPDAWTYATLVHGCAIAGDMIRAEAIVAEVIQQAQQQEQQTASSHPKQPENLHEARVNVGHPSSDISTRSHTLNGNGYPSFPSGDTDKCQGGMAVADRDSSLHRQLVHSDRYTAAQNSSSNTNHSTDSTESAGRQHVRPLASIHMYAALCNGYMRNKDPVSAERVVRRMFQESGLQPNRIMYNILMHGHWKLGLTGQARALELLSEMRRAGIQPGADTYTILIRAVEGLADSWKAQPASLSSYSNDTGSHGVGTPGNGSVVGNGTMTEQLSTKVNGVQSQASSHQAVYDAAAGQSPRRLSASNGHNAVNGQHLPAVDGNKTELTVKLAIDQPLTSLLSPKHRMAANEPTAPERSLNGVNGLALVQQVNGSDPASAASVTSECASSLAASTSLQGHGHLPSLMQQLVADGVATDAAVLTALMMAHARAGRYQLALRVFDELAANTNASMDPVALAALTAVHAAAGRLQEACKAAEQAAYAARAVRQPPPAAAFGALIQAFRRQNDLPSALGAYKQFLKYGGRPGQRMLDYIVRFCLQQNQPTAALNALRKADKVGTPVDWQRYTKVVDKWREQQSGQPMRPPDGWDRIKWWLGLPNEYYQQDWRNLP